MAESGGKRILEQRRAKLAERREQGNAYPNDFRRDCMAGDLQERYGAVSKDDLEPAAVSLAGRLMAIRIMGKSTFAQLRDGSGDIQLFIKKDSVGDDCYQECKRADVGDIVGVCGTLMKTKTDELSVRVESLRVLVKSLKPLPEKFHGLKDVELRYRQRYVDLIVNQEVREVFKKRSQIICFIQDYFDKQGFCAVETPMMHPLAGGARARPFVTHHNALDSTLYLRIAPELYLKRLVVGGFEKVYEINRSFRNEGVSTHHNPEFTMLEFYEAYNDCQGLMKFTEEFLKELCRGVCGDTTISYGDMKLDFSRAFKRLTIKEAILEHHPKLTETNLDDYEQLRAYAREISLNTDIDDTSDKLRMEIFEKSVEHKLIQPTFITEYPASLSPLARRNDQNPEVTDRFELFVAGQEIANGFSELNDPEDQAQRFEAQIKEKQAGDEEAMEYDHDYINALEYGLPPAAGEGIGIDRLVMILTDAKSIRDVILFPQMKRKEL